MSESTTSNNILVNSKENEVREVMDLVQDCTKGQIKIILEIATDVSNGALSCDELVNKYRDRFLEEGERAS